MRNCETCKHCWMDETVGDRECKKYDELTEEEADTYYSDVLDGCPHYEEGDGEIHYGYTF